MATKALSHNPTGNPFELLAQVQSGSTDKVSKNAPKVGDADYVPPSPAAKGKARAIVQAQKDAEKEAARKQAAADAAMAQLAGPLEGFVTQKSSQPRKPKEDTKKMNRETYEKTGKQAPKTDRKPYTGEKRPYEKKPQGDAKPHGEGKPYEKRQYQGEKKPYQPRADGEERRPRRDFDKQSAGKTPNKFEEKRQGGGAANWGNATEEITAPAAGWGDEGVVAEKTEETKTEEGEKKADAEVATEEAVKEVKPQVAAWDDEGFGKMTLAEYQKVKEEKEAELAKKLGGVKEKRTVEQDLSKFVIPKDELAEDEKAKALAKKASDKKAVQQRSGQKAVDLSEVFTVRGQGGAGRPGPNRAQGGAGGAAGPRAGFQGGEAGRGGANRNQGRKVPGAKQFPDLVKPQTTTTVTKA